MTNDGNESKKCNPIMELALTAADVAKEKTSKRRLSEHSDSGAPEPVTIDYVEGFHHHG